jgi:DNA-binding transcriptional ArsR family regulator
MNDRNCIRILADENQINQCKQDVAGVENKIQQMAGLLSLAGNAVRLKILFLLHREEQMCPCDLSDVLEMTPPAISQHLTHIPQNDQVVATCIAFMTAFCHLKKNISITFLY